jgi:hypothetical protein
MTAQAILDEARVQLLEAVLTGRLDADRARAILVGLEAHAGDLAALSRARSPAAAGSAR